MNKIGRTSVDPKKRALELHGTGVPTPYRVEVAIWVNNCAAVEKWIHRHLESDRVHKKREFFRSSLLEIVAALELGCSALGQKIVNTYDPKKLLTVSRIKWAREKAELERQDRIRRELEIEIEGIRTALELLRRRASAAAFCSFIAIIVGLISLLYYLGAGSWSFAVGSALVFLIGAAWSPVTDLLLRTCWGREWSKQQAKISDLKNFANDAIALGSISLKEQIEASNKKVIVSCKYCGVGLRLMAGKRGYVVCPKCGRRGFYHSQI